MKSKKLIAFLCAAAMTTSAFAGLTITASAASEPVLSLDGSSTAGWTVNDTVQLTTKTDEGSTDSYLDFLSAANKNSSDTVYNLPAAAQLTDDYVIEFDTLLNTGNGMGRLNQYTQVAFTGATPGVDTTDYGGDYARSAQHIIDDNGYTNTWATDANIGQGYTTQIAASVTSRIELQGKWIFNMKSATPNIATDGNAQIGDGKWVRVRAAVKNGKATITAADSNQVYVDEQQFDADATKLSKILLSFGRADTQNFIPTTATNIKLDNIKVYDGVANAPAFSTTGLRATAIIATPIPAAEKVAGAAPALTIPDRSGIDPVTSVQTSFNALQVGELAHIATEAQEPVAVGDKMEVQLGSRASGADAATYASVVKTADGDNAIKMNAGQFSTNGRGPVLSLKDNMSIEDLTGTNSVLGFSAYLSKTQASGMSKLYLFDDVDLSADGGNVDGNGVARYVLAVITTEDTKDEDGENIYTNGDSNIGIHVEEGWHTFTVVVSEGTYRVFVDQQYKDDAGKLSPVLKNTKVGTGDTSKAVVNLPAFAVENRKSDDGTQYSSVLIDNVVAYMFQGDLDKAAEFLPKSGEAAVETPAPTEVPKHTATITWDKTTSSATVSTTEETAFDGVLVHMSYNDDNTLKSVKIYDAKGIVKTTPKAVAFDSTDKVYNGDKIVLWNSLESMIPYGSLTVANGETKPTPTPTATATTTATTAPTPTATTTATTAPTPTATTTATTAPTATPTAVPTYAVTTAAAQNGTVTVTGADNLAAVTAGTELTITATPSLGFRVGTITVAPTATSSTTVVAVDSNNKFTMPSEAVTVTVTFDQTSTFANQMVPVAHTANSQWDRNAAATTIDNALEWFNNDADTGWSGCAYATFDLSDVDVNTIDTVTLNYAVKGESRDARAFKVYYLTDDVDIATALTQTNADRFTTKRAEIGSGTAPKDASANLTADVSTAVKARLAAGSKQVTFMFTGNAGGGQIYGKTSTDDTYKAPSLTIQKGEAAGKAIAVTVKDSEGNAVEGAMVTANEKISPASLFSLNPVYITSAKTNASGVANLRLGNGAYTITATKDGKTIKSQDLTVTDDTAATLEVKAVSYAVTVNDIAAITIPKGDTAYTATAAPTFGVTADAVAVSDATVKWSLKAAVTGVSITEAGIISVDKTATAGTATVVATYTTPEGNKVTGEKAVTLSAPAVAAVTVTGSNKVSNTTAAGTGTYTATAADKYGNDFDLTGKTVTWSIEPEVTGAAIAAGEPSTGATLTVQTSVAGDTKVNVVATVDSVKSTAYEVTVTKEATGTITKGTIENGDVTISAEAGVAGDTIVVTPTANTGYRCTGVSFTPAEGTATPATAGTGENEGKYTFAMPTPVKDVTVTATFAKIDYTITNATADAATAHGSITVAATANYQDEVTVTVTPAENYELATLKYNDGEDHNITKTGEVYKFTMPAKNVTVTATFDVHVDPYVSFADGKIQAVSLKGGQGLTYAQLKKGSVSSTSGDGGTDGLATGIDNPLVYKEGILLATQNAISGGNLKLTNGNTVTLIKVDASDLDPENNTFELGFDAQCVIKNKNANIIVTHLTGLSDLDLATATDADVTNKAATVIKDGLNQNTTKSTKTVDITNALRAGNGVAYIAIYTYTGREMLLSDFTLTPSPIYASTITVNTGAAGSETPVEGAAVTVKSGDTTVATGTTTAEGTFSAGKLHAGTYTVEVEKEGYVRVENGALTVSSTGASATFTLEEQTAAPATLSVVYTLDKSAATPAAITGVEPVNVEGSHFEGDNVTLDSTYKAAKKVETATNSGLYKVYTYKSGLETPTVTLTAGSNTVYVEMNELSGTYSYYEDFDEVGATKLTLNGSGRSAEALVAPNPDNANPSQYFSESANGGYGRAGLPVVTEAATTNKVVTMSFDANLNSTNPKLSVSTTANGSDAESNNAGNADGKAFSLHGGGGNVTVLTGTGQDVLTGKAGSWIHVEAVMDIANHTSNIKIYDYRTDGDYSSATAIYDKTAQAFRDATVTYLRGFKFTGQSGATALIDNIGVQIAQ